MVSNKFEQLIRQYVSLPSHPNAKGWFPILCKVCGDRGHKGDRAAFNFSSSGGAYHCFNCGIKATYDPSVDEDFSRNLKQVLTSFSIPKTDWGTVLLDALVNKREYSGTKSEEALTDFEPAEIPLQSTFYPLTDDKSDEFAQYAIEYLRDERRINWTDYPFMLSKRGTELKPNKWYGRLIIPIYKNNKLIFYQGRDLTDTMLKKYDTPAVSKESVLYGFDHMFSGPRDMPLYVVEGWFDAFHLDGVAVFGNTISKAQTFWLNRTPRQKVIIPDRFGNGRVLAESALDKGWAIATPDIGNCKDIDEAVRKYGLIYVLNSIRDNTHTDNFAAQTVLGVYCE